MVQLAARILPLHPRRPRHQKPPEPTVCSPLNTDDEQPSKEGDTERKTHDFAHNWVCLSDTPGSWACTKCGTTANTGIIDPPHSRGCTGWSNVLQQVGDGHQLMRYDPHPATPHHPAHYACRLCHRTAAGNSVFAHNCSGEPTRSRTQAYKRLENGLHPHGRWGRKARYQAGVPTANTSPKTQPDPAQAEPAGQISQQTPPDPAQAEPGLQADCPSWSRLPAAPLEPRVARDQQG